MLRYTQYVFLNLFKKKSTWIAASVFWLYLFLILLLVPAILHFAPMFIWNNTIIDIHAFNLIVLSIYCATTCVVIFHDSREDGTELVIMSKPIGRWKIIASKFICFLVVSLLVILIGILLMVCTLFFGKQSIKNVTGVDYVVLGKDIFSLFVGSTIVILFFGAIAILISAISGKIGIMVTTIGISVGINIIYTVMPLIATSSNSYLDKKYSISLNSHRYATVGDSNNLYDGRFVNTISASHIAGEDNTYTYAKEAESHDTTWINAYINVASQMASLFKPANSSEYKIEKNSSYGEYDMCHYTITGTHPVTQHATPANFPIVEIEITSSQEVQGLIYNLYGASNNLAIASMFGATSDDVAAIAPSNASLLSIGGGYRFFSLKELTTYNDPNLVNQFVGYEESPDGNTLWGNLGVKANLNDPNKIFHDFISTIFINNEGKWSPNEGPATQDVYKAFLGHSFDPNNPDATNADIDKIALMCYFRLKQLYAIEIYDVLKILSLGGDISQVTDEAIFNYYNEKNENKHFINNNILYHQHNDSYSIRPEDADHHDPKNNLQLFYSTVNGTQLFNDMYTYKSDLYMNNTDVVLFWSMFSFLLFTIAILIYARSDIK